MRGHNALLLAACAIALSGCGYVPKPPVMTTNAVYPAKTATQQALNDLPPPAKPVAVAVYGFADQTGQFKASDTGQNLSRAVSQGGGSILIKALQDAGQRKWFTIVEREQFKNLLNERQIILEMRERYLGESTVNPQALPALLFAGVLLEGGIISYDTNTQTGGVGAAILGIGLDQKYRQDTVRVYLRAVSVKTGEVLTSVTTSKTITSYQVSANVFKYVDTDKILETEAGYTTNEPIQVALQQAIEKAVYGMVIEGVDLRLWAFQDPEAGWPYVWRYRNERDGLLSAGDVLAAGRKDRKNRPATPAPPYPAAEARMAPPAPRSAPPRPEPAQAAMTPAVAPHDAMATAEANPFAFPLMGKTPPAATPTDLDRRPQGDLRGSSDALGASPNFKEK